jgi:hypothetical protein
LLTHHANLPLHPASPLSFYFQNAFFDLEGFDPFECIVTDHMHRDLLGILPTLIDLIKEAHSADFIAELDLW